MRKSSIGMVVVSCGAIVGVGWQLGTPALLAATTPTITPPTTATALAPVTATETPVTPPIASSSPSSTASDITSTPAPVTVVAPVSKDGTYAGSIVDTQFGTIQVAAVYANGIITDVQALKLTDQGGKSVQISNRAAPILRSEVLSAQSANVQSVSGATYTTDGYLTSLQSAIDKHGAA